MYRYLGEPNVAWQLASWQVRDSVNGKMSSAPWQPEASNGHNQYQHQHQHQHRKVHERKSDNMLPFGDSGPEKSKEGWTVFVTGVHEEAQEDDLVDVFSEFGPVKRININLDRKTGQAKGYALILFEFYTDAQDAINALHGTQVLGKTVMVDWAFVKSTGHSSARKCHRRSRSRSP